MLRIQRLAGSVVLGPQNADAAAPRIASSRRLLKTGIALPGRFSRRAKNAAVVLRSIVAGARTTAWLVGIRACY